MPRSMLSILLALVCLGCVGLIFAQPQAAPPLSVERSVAQGETQEQAAEKSSKGATSETGEASKPAPPANSDVARIVPVDLSENELRVRAVLAQPITAEFVETPLEDVAAFLSSLVKFPILLDTTELAKDGIPLDLPVTARFKKETLNAALNLLAIQSTFDWTLKNDVLMITTPEQAEVKVHYTHVYDLKPFEKYVGQLQRLNPKADDYGAIIGGSAQVICGFVGCQLKDGYTCFNAPVTLQEGLDRFIESIHDNLNGPWEYIDPPGGTIRQRGSSLIVKATFRQHQDLESVLNAILLLLKTPSKELQSVTVRRSNYDRTRDTAIEKALNARCDVDFVETPLNDVCQFLEEKIQIPVTLVHKSLQEAGIQTNVPRSLILSGFSARTVLKHLLDPIDCEAVPWEGRLLILSRSSANDGSLVYETCLHQLASTGMDSVEIIDAIQTGIDDSTGAKVTWEDIDPPGGTLVVPIGDILLVNQNYAAQRQVKVLLEKLHKVGKTSQPVKQPEEDLTRITWQYYNFASPQQAKDLATLIPEIVKPETWSGAGGSGIIKPIHQTLLIKQSLKVHRELKAWLDDFSVRAIQGPPAAVGVSGSEN